MKSTGFREVGDGLTVVDWHWLMEAAATKPGTIRFSPRTGTASAGTPGTQTRRNRQGDITPRGHGSSHRKRMVEARSSATGCREFVADLLAAQRHTWGKHHSSCRDQSSGAGPVARLLPPRSQLPEGECLCRLDFLFQPTRLCPKLLTLILECGESRSILVFWCRRLPRKALPERLDGLVELFGPLACRKRPTCCASANRATARELS